MSDKYLGDFEKGQTLRVKFNTFSQALVPTTPSVNPTVAIYKDSATEFTTGVTQPTVDYDSKAGLHELVIDTSDSVYEVGKDYDIVFTAGTVDGVDLTRTILRTFSIENRNIDANVVKIAGETANAAAAVTFPASVASEATVGNIETDTQDIQSRIPAALVDGRMVSLAQAVTDKSGYKLASDGLSLVTSWTVDITGSLSGSVGSISGVTFPSNFGLLGIDGAGIVLQVGTVDELGANALTANGAGDAIEDYVWDAQYSQHTTAGTFGKLFDVWRKSNPAIEGTIQASPGPTTTVFKTDVDYPTGAFKHSVLFFADDASIPFQNSPILTVVNNGDGTSTITIEEDTTAAPVAGDKFFIIPSNHVHAIAAIVDAVWDEATAGHTTAGTTGKALIDSGAAGNPWSTDLSSGYTGTQAGNILNEVKTNSDLIGSIGINVYPVSASTPERVAGTTLTFYRNESRSVSVVTDFTLTSLTLEFVVEDQDGVDVYSLADGSISRSNQTFTVAITTAVTAGLGQYRWSMRDVTGGGSSVIAFGVLTVQEAASNA